MKVSILSILLIIVSSTLCGLLFAQTAPNITYVSPQTYSVGTAITALTPTNTGGTIAPAIYGTVSTVTNLVSIPNGVYAITSTADASGNYYIANIGFNAIYKFTPSNATQPISLYAGSGLGVRGSANSLVPTLATFDQPNGITLDPAKANLYISDFGTSIIRKINLSTGAVTTIAGSAGIYGTTNGTGTAARFTGPAGLRVDAAGTYIYLADQNNHLIRRIQISNSNVTTVAGNGSAGGAFLDANGTAARFNYPNDLEIDATGNLIIADQSNNRVRMFVPSTTVTSTIAGSGTAGALNGTGTAAQFNSLTGVSKDGAGNIYIADYNNNNIRKITSAGVVSLFNGSPTQVAGNTDGSSAVATFNGPTNIATAPSGVMYIVDYLNNVIRKIAITGYTISSTLPAGLTFNGNTGAITGTPTAPSPATDYTITAYNYYGSSSYTVNITVNLTAPVINTPAAICGAGAVPTMTASGGSPGGGVYNWYSLPSGGTPLNTGATFTPSLALTTTFYVDYTVGGNTSLRTAVTATVNPVVSSPISGAHLSYIFSGNSSDISGNLNTGNLQNSPAPVADRFGNSGNAYSFNGSSQYITTTKQLINPKSFSISLWFKTTVAGGKLIGFTAAQNGAAGQNDRNIYMDDLGRLYYGMYNPVAYPTTYSRTISTTRSYNDGLWHHVLVTVGTNGSRMYIDNKLEIQDAVMTTPEVTTGYWIIGYGTLASWPNLPTNFYFNGVLDDIAIYNRELTSTEAVSTNNINILGNIQPVCAGNSITLVAPAVPGATQYKWTDNANTSNTQTGQTVTFPVVTTSSYSLTVTTSNAGCLTSTASTIIPNAPTFTWTGTTNNMVTDANWLYNSANTIQAPVFDGTETLVIPNGLTAYPQLNANRSIYSLTIASAASLALNGFTLNVACNVFNNNTTAGSGILYSTNPASQISWVGNLPKQSYVGASTTIPAQVGNFTVNNTASSGRVTISGGGIDIYNTLTLTNGSLTVDNTNNGALTLKSSGTVTARVAKIPSTLNVLGNVTVERWFTGGQPVNRSWRLMGSPVNVINAVPLNTSTTFDFSSLKKTILVTGTGGTANGFDSSPTNGPTMLFYNTATKLFEVPGSITTNINVARGFYFYFRGDRINNITAKVTKAATAPYYPTPEANVVGLQTGALNQQNFTYTLSNAGNGWNQLGNPYASTITLPGSSPATTMIGTTGFIYTYTSGASIVTQVASVNIASGQGFFVKSNNSTSSITFTEDLKSTAQPTGPALLLGTPVGTEEPIISLKMIQDSANYDISHLRFLDTYKKEYDEMEDADDLNGQGQTVFFSALTSDKHKVAIASQPLEKQKTSVFLSVNGNLSGLFSIEKINLTGIPFAYDILLQDHFKNDSLDMRANQVYRFNIDKSNPDTYGDNRFEVVIRKKNLPPYRLTSFSGKRTDTDVLLTWNTQNEYDYTEFELQKSTDGIKFDAIRNMQSSSTGTYNYKDAAINTASLNTYYRLKQVDINDVVSYSEVIIISVQGNDGLLSIFPNPASNIIQYHLKNNIKSSVRLQIFNSMGILMKNSTFTTPTGQQDISTLIPGSYTIKLTDVSTDKVLIAGKFIKI